MAEQIKNWEELITKLPTMTEAEARAHLNYENSTHKRKSYLKRLHQRYCTTRDAREREEVLKGTLL